MSDIENTNEQLESSTQPQESAQEQLTKQKEQYLSIIADYENRMKRTMQDANHVITSTIERLVTDLVPIIKDINNASQLVNSEAKAGLELIEKNVKNTLNKYGIQEMEIKIGDEFDPHSHQAISAVESAEHAEGKILEIRQKGYLFNKKVILPAMVVVSA